MRIKCYCDWYVTKRLVNKKAQLLEELMSQTERMPVFLLTLPDNDNNQLEFFSSFLLRQPYYEEKEIFLVGIAESYQAAAELVREITDEVTGQTGAADLRKYIMNRQKAFEES